MMSGVAGHTYVSLARSRQLWITLIVLLTFIQVGAALFEHGPEAGDTEITSERSVLINLSPGFQFYRLNLSSVMIYKDSFICFDDTPRDFYMLDKDSTVKFPVITSWASEIRTAKSAGAGSVTYRLTTNHSVLDQLSVVARRFSDFSRTFYPSYVLVVTWDDVGTVHYDGGSRNKTNTFQTLLASDGLESLVWMEYVQVQWIYDGSGVYYDDGGTMDNADFIRAQVGFYKGDGKTKYLLPSSFTPDIRHIITHSNANRPGLYIFRVDAIPMNLTVHTTTRTVGSSSSGTKKTSTSSTSLANVSSTTIDNKKDITSGPIVGMSAACVILVLIAALALLLVCRLHKNKRGKRLTTGRVAPESSATYSNENGER